MIVVVIIGIIAAIAYPSYKSYVREARRAEAQAVLLDGQIKQERYRAYNNAYATAAQLTAESLGLNSADYYTFTVTNITSSTYTINAAPVAGSDQVNDCGGATLTVNQSNTKTPAGCWKD
ncbi:Type IV pilus biogenesis protein PilE [Marinobacterium lacunae]|uniref:Type IV pilus biogenesis protein PilE n=2 Tax=Marinobacterium lacunae TaxID=1232683 RepID=A0A081G170_9GAMM|nr:Type IV pilus biogenesis protein PilE [Marinobacterium lacunae]